MDANTSCVSVSIPPVSIPRDLAKVAHGLCLMRLRLAQFFERRQLPGFEISKRAVCIPLPAKGIVPRETIGKRAIAPDQEKQLAVVKLVCQFFGGQKVFQFSAPFLRRQGENMLPRFLWRATYPKGIQGAAFPIAVLIGALRPPKSDVHGLIYSSVSSLAEPVAHGGGRNSRLSKCNLSEGVPSEICHRLSRKSSIVSPRSRTCSGVQSGACATSISLYEPLK